MIINVLKKKEERKAQGKHIYEQFLWTKKLKEKQENEIKENC